ncbi:MAG: TIGR01212 family radical SAM protein [Bacteroidia bacterium]|nr:TIGR01212 family radical SAM protein [Bacteroidia bacterium]
MESEKYNNYSNWIKNKFNERVQKISVDAGFTCPNRDGSKGNGGCIYCDNITFSPNYSSNAKSITQQLNEGIEFFNKKYPSQQYIAYFQNYTNTYSDLNNLKELYLEALSHEKVVGIAVSTRPDCVDNGALELLGELSKKYFVTIEFGVESTSDKTLSLLNRCHSFEDSVKAITKASSIGLRVCVHLIIGLPEENNLQIIEHAKQLSLLPINILKLHQLQVIKGTKLEELFLHNKNLIKIYSVDEYVDLTIDFLEHLSPEIIIERFTSESPLEKVIAPKWGGLKNFEIVDKIRKRLIERNTWQGRLV